MIGAPNKALIVFIGKVYVGICEIMSQTKISDAPQSTVAGINVL